jgi:1,2-phenylacetyl-CoA epoxidase catalytic subunit
MNDILRCLGETPNITSNNKTKIAYNITREIKSLRHEFIAKTVKEMSEEAVTLINNCLNKINYMPE